MAVQKFDLVLKSTRMITPRVRELGFARQDGASLPFEAGQFVSLMIPHPEKMLRRSYSIATVPDSGDELIRLAISEVKDGRATGRLFAMQSGDTVAAIGPAGRFVLRDDGHCRYVFLATGTGVTPFRAFLPALRDRLQDPKVSVDLVLGVRSPDELLYGDDFIAMDRAFENFRFSVCYSRVLPDASAGESIKGKIFKGYVQQHLDALELDPAHDIVYLCGNPDMIDTVAEYCEKRDFPIANVRREKYVSSN